MHNRPWPVRIRPRPVLTTMRTAAVAPGSPVLSRRSGMRIRSISAGRCRRSAQRTRGSSSWASRPACTAPTRRAGRSPAITRAYFCTRRCTNSASRAGRLRSAADDGLLLIDAASPTRSSACRPGTSRCRRRSATATRISAPISQHCPPDATVLALGRIAHDATLRALGQRPRDHAFAHGAEHALSNGVRALRQLSLQPLQHQHAAG